MATLAAARPTAAVRALPGFTWLYLAASAWLLGGLYWDGWAHGYGLPDSFWTIWHAGFYSGYVAVAAVLFGAIAMARPSALTWQAAIPRGYGWATAGAVLFAFGGVFDAIWHTLFGIETSTDALLSPSHLMLGTGIALMVTGPLRASWSGETRGGLRDQLPAVLSLTALFSLFTFFSQFAGPYAGIIGQGPRPSGSTLEKTLLGMYLFSGLTVGFALVALRNRTLPPGALTVMLGVNGIAMILMRGHTAANLQALFVGVAVVAGIAGDVIVWRLEPTAERVNATRAFAFLLPVAYFTIYLAAVVVFLGSGWTIHSLTGTVLLSGLIGLLLSVLFLSGRAPAIAPEAR
jgi:hypothetical protein